MNINKTLIGVCPKFTNNRPSHCPKCGNDSSFSKERIKGQQSGDYICDHCNVCVEDYIDSVMNLNFNGTPKQ